MHNFARLASLSILYESRSTFGPQTEVLVYDEQVEKEKQTPNGSHSTYLILSEQHNRVGQVQDLGHIRDQTLCGSFESQLI